MKRLDFQWTVSLYAALMSSPIKVLLWLLLGEIIGENSGSFLASGVVCVMGCVDTGLWGVVGRVDDGSKVDEVDDGNESNVIDDDVDVVDDDDVDVVDRGCEVDDVKDDSEEEAKF